MRARVSRHLEPVLGSMPSEAEAAPDDLGTQAERPPPEFNWRDYVAMLLDVAAEIEHSLMVEYLFAAYSMGGSQVPEESRGEVRVWQETILGIAKEEMGHLMTVQNLHTALGLPLHLDREDYPWGSGLYPFPFTLDRLTLDSVATYVVAESPPVWTGPEAEEIRTRAKADVGTSVNRVGVLYEKLAEIIGDPTRIPDVAFHPSSVLRQASWDEWGRGYAEGARPESSIPGVHAADLLIVEVSSRDTALQALAEIGEQGEAPKPIPSGDDPVDAGEQSHFVRFLTIYRALSALDPPIRDRVSRPIPANPTAASMPSGAQAWAHLFNLRYRMLLVNLAHAFDLPADGGTLGPRGGLINRTFAEMYNLRAIAATLVELPATGAGPDGPRAGPPFEMPYTLALPRRQRDCWALHRDLLEASAPLIATSRTFASGSSADYLTALSESDALALAQVERMLGHGKHAAAVGAVK